MTRSVRLGAAALVAAAWLGALVGCSADESSNSAHGGSGGSTTAPHGGHGGSAGSGGAGLGPISCPEPPAGGRVLYVDGALGDDANDGLAPDRAFRTMARALDGDAAPLAAGDTVLIKAGRYREQIHLRKSGTADARVLVRPFAQDEVVLDASTAVEGWAVESGEIYRASVGFAVQAVVVDGRPLVPEASAATLQEGRYAYDAGSGTLHVWAPGGGDPATHDLGVIEADDSKTQNALYLENASYVTVCGLTTRFAAEKGILVLGDYDRVEQCRVAFNAGIGLSVGPWDTTLSSDAEIVGNDIHDNFLRNWPRCANGYKYGGWGTGTSSQNAPRTTFRGNFVHDNGGEGIVAYGGTEGATIQDNVVFDNWSVNIYVLNQQNARIERNLVYAGEPELALLTNNGDPDPSDNACAKRLRPDGIATGDEDLGSGDPASLDHVLIANNLILGCRSGYAHVNEVAGSGIKDVSLLFNTVVLPPTKSAYENLSGIALGFNDGNNVGSVLRDNLLVGGCADCALLWADTDPSGAADLFLGLEADHNLLFHPANATPLHWGNVWEANYDHAGWLALPGGAHGDADVTADPALGDPSSHTPADLCPASAASPAIDQAIDQGVSDDFFAHARPAGAGFDLGACEWGGR